MSRMLPSSNSFVALILFVVPACAGTCGQGRATFMDPETTSPEDVDVSETPAPCPALDALGGIPEDAPCPTTPDAVLDPSLSLAERAAGKNPFDPNDLFLQGIRSRTIPEVSLLALSSCKERYILIDPDGEETPWKTREALFQYGVLQGSVTTWDDGKETTRGGQYPKNERIVIERDDFGRIRSRDTFYTLSDGTSMHALQSYRYDGTTGALLAHESKGLDGTRRVEQWSYDELGRTQSHSMTTEYSSTPIRTLRCHRYEGAMRLIDVSPNFEESIERACPLSETWRVETATFGPMGELLETARRSGNTLLQSTSYQYLRAPDQISSVLFEDIKDDEPEEARVLTYADRTRLERIAWQREGPTPDPMSWTPGLFEITYEGQTPIQVRFVPEFVDLQSTLRIDLEGEACQAPPAYWRGLSQRVRADLRYRASPRP